MTTSREFIPGPDGTVDPTNLVVVAPMVPPCRDEGAACECYAVHVFVGGKALAPGHVPFRVDCWCQPTIEADPTFGGFVVTHQVRLS